MSERVPLSELPESLRWVLTELNLVSNDHTVDRKHVQVLGEWVLRFGATAAPAPRPRASRGPTKAQQRSELTNKMGEYLLAHPGSTLGEVATALNVSVADATTASHPVDWLLLDDSELDEPSERVESETTAATRERAKAALQAASLLVSPLSHQNYTGLLKSGRVKGPSVARIVQLFGSWTSACHAVGVSSGEPLRNNYERTWTKDDLLVFVERFLRDATYRGASHQFDVWRATVNGAEKVPSLGTVRNIVGGTWSDIRTAALRRMRAQWAS
ncbi:MAG: hypothetical protein RLZ67_961 [Actinomycetota bacterium]